jgi:ion channel-forming bestrophin family protein
MIFSRFPFTAVAASGWYTLPISIAVFFIVLGVRAIGKEIENSFGYDYNDLPLDRFCETVALEFKLYGNVNTE